MSQSNNIPDNIQSELIEIKEVIEDSVEYICTEHQLSGEKVWTMINALSDAHLKQFPDYDDN